MALAAIGATKGAVIGALLLLAGLGIGLALPKLGTDASIAAAKEAAEREAAAQLRPIYGFVFDLEFYPIPNATITVVETAENFRSDMQGAYDVDAAPGNYLLIASAPGYRSAAASLSVLYGQTTRHDFLLEPKPLGVPYYEILPFKAVATCQVAFGAAPHAGFAVGCDQATAPNQLRSVVEMPVTVANALFEVHWEPQSALATHFSLASQYSVEGTSLEVGQVRGTSGLKIWLLDWFLYKHEAAGATWQNELALASGLGQADASGNQGGTGIGFAQDQPLDAYTTLFHYGPGAGDFSALDSG